MITDRKKVIWVGKEPESDIEKHFSEFELILSYKNHERALSDDELAYGVSLILDVSDTKAGLFITRIPSLIIPALNHGLKVLVICSLKNVELFNFKLAEVSIPGQVEFISRELQKDVLVKRVLFHGCSVGKAYKNSCSIKSKIQLKTPHVIFLKRAFSDCKEIYLEELSSGKSGSVFCVHAISEQGRYPPFFAKFDDKEKIKKELDNYKYFVNTFIPFNLRPNLSEERCITGAYEGLLVGDFVEHSESFADAIRHENAKIAVTSLFEETLHSWRNPVTENPNLAKLFDEIKFADLTPQRQFALHDRFCQSKKFGYTLPPLDLIDSLNSLPAVKHNFVLVHGDLHGENIRVRNKESLLIDFYSVVSGPSSRDSASLEVWLAFSKWPDNLNFRSWKKLVDDLFKDFNKVIGLPQTKFRHDVGYQVWNCIRQIRKFAFNDQIHEIEYQISLAYWLYKHSTRAVSGKSKAEINTDERKRAYAYHLSCKLTKLTHSYFSDKK